MHLITDKTTLEEFKSRRHWLIKNPATETLHHIEVVKFGDSRMRLWYAYSTQDSYGYIRDTSRQSLLAIEKMFIMLQTGNFIYKW